MKTSVRKSAKTICGPATPQKTAKNWHSPQIFGKMSADCIKKWRISASLQVRKSAPPLGGPHWLRTPWAEANRAKRKKESDMIDERTCSFCESTNMAIGHCWTIRGDPIHPWHCRTCGKVETRYASKKAAEKWAQEHGALEYVKTATMEKIEAGKIDVSEFDHMKPCEVCGRRGTSENHHWAPWYLFDAEAEKWPQSLLCRDCHQRWHRIVTPNMGNHGKAPQ
jgi:hypothetical protein